MFLKIQMCKSFQIRLKSLVSTATTTSTTSTTAAAVTTTTTTTTATTTAATTTTTRTIHDTLNLNVKLHNTVCTRIIPPRPECLGDHISLIVPLSEFVHPTGK